MGTKERRQSPRSHSNISLDIIDAEGKMIIGEGRCINMSTEGALMESPKPFARRERMRLHMPAGVKSPLEVSGQIVWARKNASSYIYGIRFDAL
jgi:hypothetical protein